MNKINNNLQINTNVNKVILEINNNHKNIKQILIIQKNVRRYLTHKYILISPSFYQTKNWRKNRKWYKNGKSNECEKYQINLINLINNNKLLQRGLF